MSGCLRYAASILRNQSLSTMQSSSMNARILPCAVRIPKFLVAAIPRCVCRTYLIGSCWVARLTVVSSLESVLPSSATITSHGCRGVCCSRSAARQRCSCFGLLYVGTITLIKAKARRVWRIRNASDLGVSKFRPMRNRVLRRLARHRDGWNQGVPIALVEELTSNAIPQACRLSGRRGSGRYVLGRSLRRTAASWQIRTAAAL